MTTYLKIESVDLTKIFRKETTSEKNMRIFIETLDNYHKILKDRDFGGIVVTSSTDKPKVGSLDYLMRVSHSVSRNCFKECVLEEFEKNIDTLKR